MHAENVLGGVVIARITSHSPTRSADRWPDDLRFLTLNSSFICLQDCGKQPVSAMSLSLVPTKKPRAMPGL
jgi:hypothetical protein